MHALSVFTRQLATLIRAGLPIVRALETIARQERRGPVHDASRAIAADIAAGGSLSDGMARQVRFFDPVYVSLVRAAEDAGMLAEVLGRLATMTEKRARLDARVRMAMLYPIVVGTIAIGIVTALLIFVTPRFEDIYSTLLKGTPLPTLTRAVLETGDLLRSHFVLCAITIAIFLLLANAALRRRSVSRIAWRALSLTPQVGAIAAKIALARFARILGELLAGGVPILQALSIGAETLGNAVLADAVETVRERVRAGDSLSGPLEATGVFPAFVTGMVAVGEETGSLPEMLSRIADAYDYEIDSFVAALTTLLEPVMVVLMALVVGTILVGLFLPIVGIIQSLS